MGVRDVATVLSRPHDVVPRANVRRAFDPLFRALAVGVCGYGVSLSTECDVARALARYLYKRGIGRHVTTGPTLAQTIPFFWSHVVDRRGCRGAGYFPFADTVRAIVRGMTLREIVDAHHTHARESTTWSTDATLARHMRVASVRRLVGERELSKGTITVVRRDCDEVGQLHRVKQAWVARRAAVQRCLWNHHIGFAFGHVARSLWGGHEWIDVLVGCA